MSPLVFLLLISVGIYHVGTLGLVEQWDPHPQPNLQDQKQLPGRASFEASLKPYLHQDLKQCPPLPTRPTTVATPTPENGSKINNLNLYLYEIDLIWFVCSMALLILMMLVCFSAANRLFNVWSKFHGRNSEAKKQVNGETGTKKVGREPKEEDKEKLVKVEKQFKV